VPTSDAVLTLMSSTVGLPNHPDATGCAGATSLREQALQAWLQSDPIDKTGAALALASWLRAPGEIDVRQIGHARHFDDRQRPGRPDAPVLVHPREVPSRGIGSPLGRAALLHAIAHIEFNAVDLALDAVWRFADMPAAWYLDWTRVALEEARHFRLIADELERRGHAYGDFAAHDGLWEMALKTRHDPLDRVALVPRLMEARGLDVTPGLIRRLSGVGDTAAVAILDVILREEVDHVRIGNHWYARLCQARGLEPVAHWESLAARHAVARPHPPFNVPARLQAGFMPEELARWSSP